MRNVRATKEVQSIDEGEMKIRIGIKQNPALVYVTYGLDLD